MAMEHQPEAIDHLSALPDELKLNILSYLPASGLATVSSVNKEWDNLASDDTLWSNLNFETSPSLTEKSENLSWKESYKKEEMTPIQVRFSIRKINLNLVHDIDIFHVNFMGNHISLPQNTEEETLRPENLVPLTKSQIRRHYGCSYSLASVFIRPLTSKLQDSTVYWDGIKDVNAEIALTKDALLNSFHDLEAFKLSFLDDYKTSGVSLLLKSQSQKNKA